MREQAPFIASQRGRISEAELREQSREFLRLLGQAVRSGDLMDLTGARP
jgi:hypothetical protein